ncbi:MAG TPA: hypothetical protein EYP85_09035 [Armatimonadetes bacterium]|nr:hypothetical protein [Armatimonadota bacterium]
MNLILIIADTLRWDALGAYGSEWVRTPYLDALAEKCLIFDRAYCGSFPTMPMRADLFTGHTVFQSIGWAPLPAGEVPLAQRLRQQGYLTMMTTDHLQMLAPGMNYHRGFRRVEWIRGQVPDVVVTEPLSPKWPCGQEKVRNPAACEQYLRNRTLRRYEREHCGPQVVQAAIDWLERNYRHEKFFLCLDIFDTHEPWDPPRWYVDWYDPDYEGEEVIWPRYDRIDYLTQAELRHVRALYAGTVTLLDRWLGRLFELLDWLRLWERTAVIFLADHGFYLGEHRLIGKHTVIKPQEGWPMYEEVARIPLLMYLPGMEPSRWEVLVQPVDLMPTMLELCGCRVPEGLHGRSLLPVLRGETKTIRELAVSSPRLPTEPEGRVYSTVTDGEWTLLDAADQAPPELYHLPTDPRQERNVAAQRREVVERLHGAYLQFLSAVGTSKERLALRQRLGEP